jgi:putative peptidoglycan lipid II flippase
VLRKTALRLNVLFAVRVTLSFVSYALMARAFGTSIAMDTFWIAITPTVIVQNLMEGSGVGAAMTYYTSLTQYTVERRRSEVLGFLLVWAVVGLVMAAASFGLADATVRALGPGMPAAVRQTTVALVQLCSAALALGPVSILAAGLLNAHGAFIGAAATALLPPGLLTIGQLVLSPDVSGLAGLFVAGYGAAAITALLLIHRHIGLAGIKPSIEKVQGFFAQFGPLLGGALCIQAIIARERALASHLGEGAISALSFALRIVTVAGGLIGTGFDATVTAVVARQHARGDDRALRDHVRSSLRLVAVLAIVPGLALVLVPEGIVAAIFERGGFDARSVGLTSAAVVGYFGLYVWSSLGRVLFPAAVGRLRAKRSLVFSLAGLVSYLLIAPVLSGSLGVGGLALAASVAFSVITVLYAIDVRG